MSKRSLEKDKKHLLLWTSPVAGLKSEMELEKSSSLRPPLTNGSCWLWLYAPGIKGRMLRHSKNTCASQEAIMVDLPLSMAITASIRQTWLLNLFDVYMILRLLNRPDWDCRKWEQGWDSHFMHLWLLGSWQTLQKASAQGCNWVIIQECDYPVCTELYKNCVQTYNQENRERTYGMTSEFLLGHPTKTTPYYFECYVCLDYILLIQYICHVCMCLSCRMFRPLSSAKLYKKKSNSDTSHKTCMFYASAPKSD